MGFGMGLGAFAQGLAGGLAIGDALQKSSEERETKSQIAAATEEVKQQFGDKFGTDEANAALNSRISTIHNKAGRLDEARKAAALSDSFKSRQEETALKAGLKSASEEANQKFGDGKGGLTDEGYAFMMKKSAGALIAAGQHDKAREYLKWAEDSNTKANTKRFANGLLQIDMGDIEGFDKTLSGLGAAKGYGPEVGVGFVRGEDGKIITNKGADGEVYYRMKITPPGATESVLQDIPKSKMKDVYARWFNPQAAFEAEQSAAQSKAKRKADIEDYEAKKGIDNKYADPQQTAKDRGGAIDGLRKRDFNGKAFDDLPDAQKEAEVQKELSLRRGGIGFSSGSAQGFGLPSAVPSAHSRPVVMDRATGQPVKLSAQGAGSPQQNTASGLPKTSQISAAVQGSPQPSASEDGEITALQQDAMALDRKMADTQARSRNPDAAETLLGPMRTARAEIDNRLRLVQESRGIAAPQTKAPALDIAKRSAELDQVNRQIVDLQNRQGGGASYKDALSTLEQRKGALLEEMNAARRTWR